MYIPLPKSTKNRIPGRRYLRANKVVIWTGNGLACEHNRKPSRCKECGGSQLCYHGRVYTRCRDCNQGKICKHYRIKENCKDCTGRTLCPHLNVKSYCKECNKNNEYCQHKRRKSRCFMCDKKRCKNSLCKSILKDNEYEGYCFVCFVLF